MESGTITTADGFRQAYAEIFADVGTLAAELDDARAMLPTGCPGWTVRDHLAHITDLESLLTGRPRPDHIVPEGLPYIRNQPGAFMEIGVDARRRVPLPALLDEYRGVTAARLAQLATLQDAQLGEMGPGLFGDAKVSSMLGIRVFDLWSHEQDIRRALQRPGGLDGVAAAHSRERMLIGAGYEIQERIAPPAGTVLAFDITGPGGAIRSITFDGAKGRSSVATPDTPASTLRLDLPTLTILTCGRRVDPDPRSRVIVEGDQNLGRLVLEDLAVTP
jgi:uncharacterized protein (TIGR03083 family)